MKSHLILFSLMAMVLFACKNDKPADDKKDKPMESGISKADIVGEWVSSSFTIEIKSKDGTGADSLVQASEDTFGELLGYKANFTTFAENGTFEDVYQLVNDSIERGSGTWMLEGDNLTLQTPVPEPQTQTYKVSITDDGSLKATRMMDFDGDGAEDDAFTGLSYKRE